MHGHFYTFLKKPVFVLNLVIVVNVVILNVVTASK